VTGLLNDPTNSAVVALAGGGAHSLALKSNGTVWAWGLNSWGQLGTGTFTGTAVNGYVCVSTPVQVLGLPSQTDGRTIVAIAAGYWHSLALKSDGTVWAWGDNTYGELGNGTFAGTAIYSNTDYLLGTGIATPAQVLGPNGTGALTGIVAIAAGCYHNLALKSDGTVWAWGENSYGELGNGTFTSTTPYGLALPAQVSGLSSIIAIGGGFGFSSALKSNGTVWASGYNANGQLGNGTFTGNGPPGDRTDTFGQVIGLSGVLAISAGFEQTLAIHSDSTAWAWGNDQWGELGNGTFTTTGNLGIATPAEVIDLP
jgi:alpha-tubulin suppressor-like RCC1 family protein